LRSPTPGPVYLSAAWEKVVEIYSGRLLIIEQYRIPEIAGIFRHFASVLNGEPVLGLWKTTISRDTAWTRLWVQRPAKAPGGLSLCRSLNNQRFLAWLCISPYD
jgi:hypothetical protein